MSSHPRQPIEPDEHGVVRFKRNHVVRYMLDHPDADLNILSREVQLGRLPEADYMQLMQLVGYSVSGYGDLADSGSEARQADADECDEIAQQVWADWKVAQPDG